MFDASITKSVVIVDATHSHDPTVNAVLGTTAEPVYYEVRGDGPGVLLVG